jgi:starvation-inducible DNA-binding protein
VRLDLRIPIYNIANIFPEQLRSRWLARLNRNLAAAIYLHALVKQAHPNVRGPTIIAFDELFEKVADALKEYSDKIAERAGTLAGRRMAAPSLLEPFNGIPQGPNLTVGQPLGNNVADRERVVSKTTRDRHASAL